MNVDTFKYGQISFGVGDEHQGYSYSFKGCRRVLHILPEEYKNGFYELGYYIGIPIIPTTSFKTYATCILISLFKEELMSGP